MDATGTKENFPDPLEQPAEVIAFWMQAGARRWFVRDAAFDREIHTRGRVLHRRAAGGELAAWEASAEGALALVLLLDQFSRNLHRDDARAYAQDNLALATARRAIFRGMDKRLPKEQQRWLYMPFMHSEDISAQRCGLAYFQALEDADIWHYAVQHAEIIERFGRFPHRNEVLGRESSTEEIAYLAEGGFRG